MKNIGIVIGVILAAGLIAFGWYQSGYNAAISKDEAVKAAWSQVENQLQRRFDLVPNLVNTVKGFAAQEMTLFTEVTKLRSQWSQSQTIPDKIEAADAMTGALSRLLAVAENYPQIKSNENFLALQTQLEGTENRIAVERMRYNTSAEDFNRYRRSFFGRFFTAQANIQEPAVYFKVTEAAKENPTVNFQ